MLQDEIELDLLLHELADVKNHIHRIAFRCYVCEQYRVNRDFHALSIGLKQPICKKCAEEDQCDSPGCSYSKQ